MIRTAVIGLGEISKIHIPVIKSQSQSELVSVCDLDITLKDNYGDINFYTDYIEMLDTEKLDCVHICLPHYLHYEVTKACVERNINVFLEKPMSLNYGEAKELLEISEKSSVKVCVCMQNRLNESIEKLIEIKDSKEYGEILGVKGLVSWFRPKEYYDTSPWRKNMKLAGGGAMINQSIHTLDLMYYLCGEVESIKGGIDNILHLENEVEDTAYANINFKSGARGMYFATVASVDNSSVELEVLFEKGKFIVKDSMLIEETEDCGKVKIVEDSKVPGTKFYYGASHMTLINKFHNCIINDLDDYIHVRDGIESIKMIDAIRKSSKLNKNVKMEEL